MKGLLLLDVDGPLNPYEAQAERRPPGYLTFRYAKGAWYSGKQAKRRKGMRVWLNPGHGPMLTGLADETGLALVWATTWEHGANRYIGPAIGLPELPVIEFADTRRQWKWPDVLSYADGLPLAWLDDNHNLEPGREEFEEARAGTPTLLCHVDPATGLQPAHLDEIRDWATRLP